MRRDQSASGAEYRRKHNQEMWDRQNLPAIIYNPLVTCDHRSVGIARIRCMIAYRAVEEQEVGE